MCANCSEGSLSGICLLDGEMTSRMRQERMDVREKGWAVPGNQGRMLGLDVMGTREQKVTR